MDGILTIDKSSSTIHAGYRIVFDMGPDCLHQCQNLPRGFVTAPNTDWTTGMLKVETLTTEPTEIQD